MDELRNWLGDKSSFRYRNSWFSIGPVDVYLRRSTRFGKDYVDVANVVCEENQRQQGHFSRFLRGLEYYSIELGYSGIYVENVFNEILSAYLVRVGYKLQDRTVPPSFYKEF